MEKNYLINWFKCNNRLQLLASTNLPAHPRLRLYPCALQNLGEWCLPENIKTQFHILMKLKFRKYVATSSARDSKFDNYTCSTYVTVSKPLCGWSGNPEGGDTAVINGSKNTINNNVNTQISFIIHKVSSGIYIYIYLKSHLAWETDPDSSTQSWKIKYPRKRIN